jgi:hypothetical protein
LRGDVDVPRAHKPVPAMQKSRNSCKSLPTPQVPPVDFTGCQERHKRCLDRLLAIYRSIPTGARSPKNAARWPCARSPFLCRLQFGLPCLLRLPLHPVQTARAH